MSQVFISYSQKDRKYLRELQIHLKPLIREGVADIWDDTRLKGGDLWRKSIKESIESAQIAILLVSEHFLASEFIDDNELPPILDKARSEGLVVLQVILSSCLWNRNKSLIEYQTINNPSKPLNGIGKVGRGKIWVELAKRIEEIENDLSKEVLKPQIRKTGKENDSSELQTDNQTEELRRLDAAMPGRISVRRPTELWVQICLTDSEGFRRDLPKYTEGGEEIAKEDVKAGNLHVRYQIDENTNKPLPTTLRIELSAPDFITEKPYQDIRLSHSRNSEVLHFALTPQELGKNCFVHVTASKRTHEGTRITLGSVRLCSQVVQKGAAPIKNVSWTIVSSVSPPTVVYHKSEESQATFSPDIGPPRFAVLASIVAGIALLISVGLWNLNDDDLRPVSEQTIINETDSRNNDGYNPVIVSSVQNNCGPSTFSGYSDLSITIPCTRTDEQGNLIPDPVSHDAVNLSIQGLGLDYRGFLFLGHKETGKGYMGARYRFSLDSIVVKENYRDSRAYYTIEEAQGESKKITLSWEAWRYRDGNTAQVKERFPYNTPLAQKFEFLMPANYERGDYQKPLYEDSAVKLWVYINTEGEYQGRINDQSLSPESDVKSPFLLNNVTVNDTRAQIFLKIDRVE